MFQKFTLNERELLKLKEPIFELISQERVDQGVIVYLLS